MGRVFIAISYNRDNETQVCGVARTRDGARRLVEIERNEMLRFSDYAADGPDGSASLDDMHGDMVGFCLSKEVVE